MSTDTEDVDPKLTSLHGLLCDELTKRLKDGEEVVTKDGDVVTKDASPATLSVIRQFLKDNHVEGTLGKGKPLQNMVDSLPTDFGEGDGDEEKVVYL